MAPVVTVETLTGGIDNHVHRAPARLCPRATREASKLALASSLLQGSIVVVDTPDALVSLGALRSRADLTLTHRLRTWLQW